MAARNEYYLDLSQLDARHCQRLQRDMDFRVVEESDVDALAAQSVGSLLRER
jgi:hypothetical protein